MLEILLLFTLCQDIGAKLRPKGIKPLPFQIAAVFTWVVFEFIGAVIGLIVHTMLYGRPENTLFSLTPVFALVAGAIGGGIVMLVAYRVASRAKSAT